MKLAKFVLALAVVPCAVYAGERATSSRVGMVAVGAATTRVPALPVVKLASSPATVEARTVTVTEQVPVETVVTVAAESAQPENCRDAYRQCMDDFCLLDETEGSRCACSDNIEKSKDLIQEVQKIQSEADALYTEGVEREKLGAKAKLVFGESNAARRSAQRSGIDFSAWLSGGTADTELDEDNDIGSGLYAMAAQACQAELDACGAKATAEENLYVREIVKDCKAFNSYLSDQKRDAEMNKKAAESAVRTARLEMLDTTNKYNRGECLLVYRSCIADKGGCGVNFENCLDASLLNRRSHACEDVLDQCMAVRSYVLADWEEESASILVEAEKYADRNMRVTCLAQIQNCLEEGCQKSTETACLTDVTVAAGICPIIEECNGKIPGLQSAINDKLAYLQLKFCENDVDSCLKDKCGTDFTKPECVGKKAKDIATDMCPQSIFPSCKNMSTANFDVIINSAMLHMDYQLLTGCINQFSEKLTAVCGTDMTCLSVDDLLPTVDKWVNLQITDAGHDYVAEAKRKADAAVDRFFKEFEQDLTLSACKDVYSQSSTRVIGRSSMRDTINTTAKMIAKISAENRALRELASRMDELKIKEETNKARKYCMEKYQEGKRTSGDDKNYSYISTVMYEPELKNCHVCRVQHVCETGGEKEWTSALKAAAGGLSAGASAGTMVSPGWGTAIGGVVGAVGAGFMGYKSGGQEDFCQDLESCEDINVSGASLDDDTVVNTGARSASSSLR